MLRLAGLAVILAVVLPALFAYASTFNISYGGSGVIVVPKEDIITVETDAPAQSGAGAPVMISREPTVAAPGTAESNCSNSGPGANGGDSCANEREPKPAGDGGLKAGGGERELRTTAREPTPRTPVARVTQTPMLVGGRR